MATLVERLHQKEDEIKGIISEYEREKRLIPEYAEVFDEYREHPLVWRVMNTDMTFESDIQKTLVKRYKSRFRKYVFDRADKDFSLRLSMYRNIYGETLYPIVEYYFSIVNICALGIFTYLNGKEKQDLINSLLDKASYLDSVADKVKKLDGG